LDEDMTFAAFVQYCIITLAGVFSAWVMLKKLAPSTARRLRGRLALWLLRPQRGAFLRALGRKLVPPAVSAGACGSCGQCGPQRMSTRTDSTGV